MTRTVECRAESQTGVTGGVLYLLFRALAGSAAGTLMFVAYSAKAQDRPVPDDLVVTAQLREQNPLVVPIAITALGAKELERLGLEEFDEMSRFVPGFTVQNQSPNNPGFVMRGVTSESGAAFNEPRVSVFQDGVSISRSRGSYVELFDLERVEVAKGPQSTLYGRGALIGAVNVIQNKADTGGFAAATRGSYGNYNALMLEGMMNIPLADGVAARVAGRIRKNDGTVANLLNGEDFNSADTKAVRGSFRIETSILTFDLIGNYQKDEPSGTAFKSIAYRPVDPATGAVIGDTGRYSAAALASSTNFEGGRPLGIDRSVWGITGVATWALGEHLALTSITAYRRFSALEILDVDGISLPLLTAAEDARGRQASQEFRLKLEKGPVTAFIGSSYLRDSGTQRTPAQFDERMLLALLTGQLAGPVPGRPATDPAPAAIFANVGFTGALLQGMAAASGVSLSGAQARAIAANLKPAHFETTTNYSHMRAFDLFGDATLRLSDQFEIGLGLRYTHDDKRTGYSSAVLNGRAILGGVIGALSQPASARDALLAALAVPGAATIAPSASYPVPLFGLGVQPTANNGQIDQDMLKDEGFAWRLTARYAPTPDISLYASYSRGRRPEVLSTATPSVPFRPARFDHLPSETVDSYELGMKTVLANHRLSWESALFFYQYQNFQALVQQGTRFIITNAGDAESYGLESQARWSPSQALSLFASYAYNHSRFNTGIWGGNRFRLSPDHSISLGVMLDLPLGGGRVSFTPSLTYQSRIFFDENNDLPDLQRPPAALVADNVQDEVQRGYALTNMQLGYAGGDSGWHVAVFVQNLFDNKYVKDAGNIGDVLGLPTFISGKPRFYGLRASFEFRNVR